MQKLVLKNGLTILYHKKPGRAVAIQIMVRIGSNQEQAGQRGIAHMVEHLVFEGTKKRKSGNEIARVIENVGGDFNAYTSNHRTCYYVKVLQKHAPRSIALLSDIMQNSIMREMDFQREREVVYKEIDMFLDDPKSFQWLELEKLLFKKNNAKYPSSGVKKDLKNLTRDDVFAFYKKYYSPQNVVISIAGDFPKWKNHIRKHFSDWKNSNYISNRFLIKEPLLKQNKNKCIKKSYSSSYLLAGVNCAARTSADSYVLDLIQAHLGRGQSGRLFHELRGKLGLVYDVAVEYGSDIDFGYFVVYASYSKKNQKLVHSVIKKELSNLQKVTVQELKEAKAYIEGDHYLDLEDAQKYADQLLYWHDLGGSAKLKEYVSQIKKVTIADFHRVAKKYFSKIAMVELEGK